MIEKGLTGTPSTLAHAVFLHAAELGEKPFFIFYGARGTQSFTYAALARRCAQFAQRLTQDGVEPGETVIISQPLAPDLLAGFLGSILAGAVPAIMPYPNAKQRDELFWTSHAALYRSIAPARFILSEPIATLYTEYLPQSAGRIILSSEVDGETTCDIASLDPKQTAFLQHSSGTTSLKKGVKLSHEAVIRHVRDYAATIGFNRESRVISWLPLYHDMGLISSFIMPLVHGATVVAIDNFEWVARPMLMLKAVEEFRCNFGWMPNFGFAHLTRSCPAPQSHDLSSLKALINCSEPCRPDTQALFASHFESARLEQETVRVCYAMAETVFAVTQSRAGEPARSILVSAEAMGRNIAVPAVGEEAVLAFASCGVPLSGTEVTIVDETRAPLPDGTVGEIAISAPTLFDGYNGRDDLTAACLQDGRYHSNDLGFILDGELYVTGRRDDLILAYGRNLMAHEMEAIINQVAGVRPGRCVVFGIASEELGTNEIAVMVELEPGADEPAVKKAIRLALEAGASIAPRHILVVEPGELLKTTSGKIGRAANKAAFLKQLNPTGTP